MRLIPVRPLSPVDTMSFFSQIGRHASNFQNPVCDVSHAGRWISSRLQSEQESRRLLPSLGELGRAARGFIVNGKIYICLDRTVIAL
jgi:hypothetical protein